MREPNRIPELDGLRTWMIFLISWYHIWQQSWLQPKIGSLSLDFLVRSGYVWVDGTILLSAFLLFLPYARHAAGYASMPDTRSFYLRRIRRILPSYYFILLLVFFAVALPWRLYSSGPYMVKDLVTHFTFTFPFFYDTYVATPLGAASWTLAIEVQAYLLFPLVARSVLRRPVLTLGCITLVTFSFRAWCLWGLQDYTMVVNQLLNFGDVYVLGITAAILYVRLNRVYEQLSAHKKRRLLWESAATVLFLLILWGMIRLLKVQAASSGYPQLQARQMTLRPAFALGFAGLTLCCSFCLKPLRRLLGNPVTRFLSGLSMNYYLTHQTIIVHLKRIGFPPSVSETPNTVGEQPWQTQYTLYAFGLSFLAALLITYGVEKPAGRWLEKKFSSPSPSRASSGVSSR